MAALYPLGFGVANQEIDSLCKQLLTLAVELGYKKEVMLE